MFARHTLAVLALATALTAAPALAQGYDDPYDRDGYDSAPPLPPMPAAPPPAARQPYGGPGPMVGYSVEQRRAWLDECRSRMAPRDDGVGGAVIGGVVGGIAGNRIAGSGHRTEGTIIGAGVGAVAGAAIDRAEDRGPARDFCEDYLARYETSVSAGYPSGGYAYSGGAQGYGSGYPYVSGGVMWVPVMISGGCGHSCQCGNCGCKPKKKVVEEWIEEVPAPVPARRVIHDKRIRIEAPAKPSKYSKTKYIK